IHACEPCAAPRRHAARAARSGSRGGGYSLGAGCHRPPRAPSNDRMSFLLALSLVCAAASDGLAVDDFACLDHTGKFQRLSRYADAQLVVLYVFAEDCPIVRQDARELALLAA